MADSHLSSFEEFAASLKYFFFLFRRPFPAQLEQAAQVQWARLQKGDTLVKEDGQNNPLVELRLDPAFGQAICAALADARGELPCLAVPRLPEQVAFWQSCASATMFPSAFEELSETTSHFETLRGALAWYAAGLGAAAAGTPLRICVLGASARYEYAVGVSGVEDLAERLASLVQAAAPGRRAEFVLCGRDVPPALNGREVPSKCGTVTTRHFVGYLHDLPGDGASLAGSLFVALHSGMGLDHPELAASWPPTLQRLRASAPAWLAVSSFNPVEHEAAQRALGAGLLSQLAVEVSGPNKAGSLCGPDAVGPFDGTQGKRNYSLLLARLTAPQPVSGEGWDLFD